MANTLEREAWLAGRDAGTEFAEGQLGGHGHTTALVAAQQHYAAYLFAAWLHGFGFGITERVGPIPGHQLNSVVERGQPLHTIRTELVRD